MLSKNNKYLKQTKEGTKVESYSIKKFKVGAASVVVGASIFFGAGVAAASEDVANNTTADNTTNAASEEAPKAVAVETTEVETPKQATTEEVTAAVAEKEVVEADKTTLEKNIKNLEEVLSTVDSSKAPASTLAAAKVQLESAKEVLENKTATQEEVDRAAKKVSEQNFVISSMPKAGEIKKEVTEGANSIQNTGSNDPRNGQSMGEGEALRADSDSTDASSTTASAKEELAKKVKILDEVLKNTDITKNLEAQLLTDSFAALKSAQDVLNNDSATTSEIEAATRKASNYGQAIFKQIPLTPTSSDAINKATIGSGVGVLVDTKETATPNMDDANGAVIKQAPPTVVYGTTLQPTSAENQYTFAYMPPLYLEYINVAPEEARTLYIRGSRSKDTNNTDVLVEIVKIADNTVVESRTLKAGENYKSTAMNAKGYGVYIGYDTTSVGSQSIGKIVSYLSSYGSAWSLGSFEIPREADYTTKYMTVDGKEIATYTLKGWSDQISEPSGVRDFTNYKYIDTVVNSTPELNVDEIDSIERLATSYGAKVLRKVVKPDGTVVKSFWIKDPTLNNDSSKIASDSGSDTTGYIKLFETDEIAPWATNTNLNFFYGEATKMSNGEVLMTQENAEKIKSLAAQVVKTVPIFNGASANTVRIYTNPEDEGKPESDAIRSIEIGFVGNFESVAPYGVEIPGKSLYVRNRTLGSGKPNNYQLVPLYNNLLFVPEMTYIYDQAASVVVKYVDSKGKDIIDPVTVVDKVEVSKKTSYNTTSYKKDTITDKDGNTYYLKGVKEGSSPEEGTLDSLGVRTISYVYEKAGSVVVKYETTDGTQLTGELTFDDDTSKTNVPVSGLVDEKNAKPGTPYSTTDHKPATITTADGKVYYLVGIDADKSVYDNDTPTDATDDEKVSENGVVKSGTTTVTYKYEKAGSVTINYIATDGTVLQEPVKDVVNGKPRTSYDATENSDSKEERPTVLSKGGKVYRLVQTAGTTTNGVTYDANGVATGEGYSATRGTVEAGVDKNVTYVYEEVVGSVEIKYIDEAGNPISGTTTGITKTSVKSTEKDVDAKGNEVTNVAVGTKYDTTDLRPETITTAEGKVYKLLPKLTKGNETGDVVEGTTTVTYVYQEVKGNVEVNYVDENNNPIAGKTTGITKTTVESTETDLKDASNGTSYDTSDLRPETITTADGTVYYLVGIQKGSAPESGNDAKVVAGETKKVTYVYQKAGSVVVNYVDTAGNKLSGTTTGIAKASVESSEADETNVSPGTDYNTADLRPATITTKDGKTYKLVEKNNGLQEGSAKETGKVESGKTTEVTYVYEEVKGNVVVKYVTTDGKPLDGKLTADGKETEAPTTGIVDTQESAINTEYNTTDHKPTTITKDGKTYKLVAKNNGLQEGSAAETGKVTEGTTIVTYVYEEVKYGSVEVAYVNTDGKEIAPTETTVAKEEVGKDYTTNPKQEIKVTNEDGTTTTYRLVKQAGTTTNGVSYDANGVATGEGNSAAAGKVVEGTQKVTYVYEAVKGNVVVNYIDENGNPISGTTTGIAKTSVKKSEEDVTNVNAGSKYDTTDLRPETITTAEGKVYKLLPALTKGNETGEVTEGTTEVTYVYQLVKGDVDVHYVNEEGKEIAPTVKAYDDADTGSDYDTTSKRLEKIIEDKTGDVYYYKEVKSGDKETGKVTEGTTNVTYVYQKAGSVVVNYVDTAGNKLSGTTTGIAKASVETSEADETNAAPGTDYNTADLRPETITTKDGKTYKLVAKNNGLQEGSASETGKVESGKTTEVTYVYEEVKGNVVVHYVVKNADGTTTELQPDYKDVIDASVGTKYNTAENATEKPTTITKDGKTYKLVAVEGNETGEVKAGTTEVTYVYEEVKTPTEEKGSVVVHYVVKNADGTTTELQKDYKDVTDASVGTKYNTAENATEKPTTITKDGKTYKLVAVEGNETGEVKAGTTEVTYVYEEVKYGSVEVAYVNTDGKEIAPTETTVAKEEVGKDYETTPKEVITVKNADGTTTTYKLVTKAGTTTTGVTYNENGVATGEGNSAATGKVVEGTQKVTYVYEEVKTSEKTGIVIVKYVDENGKELISSRVDTKESPVGTKYNTNEPGENPRNITKDGKKYRFDHVEGNEEGSVTPGTTVVTYVYKEVTTPTTTVTTRYVDESGKEIAPKEEGTKEAKKIDGYYFTGKTEKDEKGNITHIYAQVVTTYIEEGTRTVLSPEEKGAKNPKEISGYELVRTYTDKDGNTVHVYKKVTTQTGKVTKFVDENGNPVSSKEKGKQNPKEISGYELVRTYTDKDGNTIHVYKKVTTSTGKVTKFVDEDGNPVSSEEKGAKNPKEISGYELVRTYTDKDGNTIHVYKKVTTPTGKVTKFVDENGNPVSSEEKGKQNPKEVSGYELVRTYTDKDGNTIHVYKKATNPTPTVDKHTLYVDVDGNEIRPTEEGTQPMKNIVGYEFVETKVDEKGNTVHVYRKVMTPEQPTAPAKPTVVKEGKQLPNTDATSNNSAAGVGLIGMVAAAIAARRKRNK